ncbi:hypothetical protein BDF19DRAFT_262846 [Syncephalis fuscata]|nr:hypothetical protein BDF19DRAFT_262846 [Syncephalis fuscata]
MFVKELLSKFTSICGLINVLNHCCFVISAIESGDYKRFIYWNYDGTEFIIPSKKHFTLYVLGSFTAQNHFTSFERQLNMYELNVNPMAVQHENQK